MTTLLNFLDTDAIRPRILLLLRQPVLGNSRWNLLDSFWVDSVLDDDHVFFPLVGEALCVELSNFDGRGGIDPSSELEPLRCRKIVATFCN